MSEEEAEVRPNQSKEICTLVFQEMIEEADLDGDGNINYEEFISVVLIKVSFSSKTIYLEKLSFRAPKETRRRSKKNVRRRKKNPRRKRKDTAAGGHSKHFLQNKVNEFAILIIT